MGIAAAVVGAGVLGAAASVGSGLIGANAAKSASDAQVAQDQAALSVQQQENQQAVDIQSNNDAQALAIQQAQQSQALGIQQQAEGQAVQSEVGGTNAASSQLAPYADIGLGATQQLANLYGISYASQGNGQAVTGPNGVITPANSNMANSSLGGASAERAAQTQFTQSPDYNFAFTQGLQALDRSAAATGTLGSGGQSKAAIEFGQGLASQQYGNYFARLQSLSGMGQTASGSLANVLQNGGNSIGATQLNAGNSQANTLLTGAGQQGNTLVQGANNQASTLQSGANAEANTLVGTGTAQAAGIVGSANALTGGITGGAGALGSAATLSLLASKLGTQTPSAYASSTQAPLDNYNNGANISLTGQLQQNAGYYGGS